MEKAQLVAKSIWLTENEAAWLQESVARTGETEGPVLNRAALEGLRAQRLHDGLSAYLMGADTQAAAELAGLPRAQFLHEVMARGVALLRGPSTVLEETAYLAELFQDARLRAAAEAVATDETRPTGTADQP